MKNNLQKTSHYYAVIFSFLIYQPIQQTIMPLRQMEELAEAATWISRCRKCTRSFRPRNPLINHLRRLKIGNRMPYIRSEKGAVSNEKASTSRICLVEKEFKFHRRVLITMKKKLALVVVHEIYGVNDHMHHEHRPLHFISL